MNYFTKEKREEYYPDCYMIPPMLAWKLPKNKQNMRQEVFTNEKYFAEVKIDGSCYTFEHTPEGNTYLFSRTISTKNGLLVEKSDRVPHLVETLKQLIPRGTVIALEIYKPNGKSKDVTTIMGCLAAKAIKRQEESGKLHAYVHDMLILEGESLMETSAIRRLEVLSNIVIASEYIRVAFPILHHIDEYLEKVWQQGYEGIILKGMDSKYSPGKRPAWSWIKFKPEDAFDVICLGFEDPTKEYTGKTDLSDWKYWEGEMPVTKSYANGWIGSLIIGCVKEDGEIYRIGTVASGLTEKVLESIKQNLESFINKPLKVKAMETTSDNKLREPKFIEFRDDINFNECTFNKIFT